MLKKIATQILMTMIMLLFSGIDSFAQTEIPINFKRGSSSANVSNMLPASEHRMYVLTARRGQKLSAIVSSPDGKVVFCRTEYSPTNGSKTYRTTTEAGKNYVCIENIKFNGKASSFKLTITIR